MEIGELGRRFRDFGEVEAAGSSALYAGMASRVAEDGEVLAVATAIPDNQPIANLLFASVQVLLGRDGRAIKMGESIDSAYQRLRDVVLGRSEEVARLLSTRIVQTNEARRSILLFPAFVRICEEITGRKVALVEIGTSAGLNLLFDRYLFQFDDGAPFGDLDSSLKIRSKLRGPGIPPTVRPANEIVSRLGIDLNPIDIDVPEDVEWLRALIWPEHTDRLTLLDEAIAIRRKADVAILAGDGIQLLPGLLAQIPREVVPLVFHKFVANQFSTESRTRLLAEFDELGTRRDIVHLHNNIEPHLHATIFRDGARLDVPLAKSDGHARWVEWL